MDVAVVETARRRPAVLPPCRVARRTSSGGEAKSHDPLLFVVLLLRGDGQRIAADHTCCGLASSWMGSGIRCSSNVEPQRRLGTQGRRSWHGRVVRLHLVRVEGVAFGDTSSGLAPRSQRAGAIGRIEEWRRLYILGLLGGVHPVGLEQGQLRRVGRWEGKQRRVRKLGSCCCVGAAYSFGSAKTRARGKRRCRIVERC